MQISEITQQTSETWLDTAKAYVAQNTGNKETAYILGFTGGLYDGFVQGMKVAGIKKGAQTSEDLAEYLMSAGVSTNAIKKAFQEEFPQGFPAVEKPEEQPKALPKPKSGYSQFDNDKGTAQDRKDAQVKGEEEQAWKDWEKDNPNSVPEARGEGQEEPQVIDRSGEPPTAREKARSLAIKLKNKLRQRRSSKPGGPMATRITPPKDPDDTIDLPPEFKNDDRSWHGPKSPQSRWKKESLIVEQEKIIRYSIIKKVISNAVRTQSRIGSGLNKVTIPGNAQHPTVHAKQIFQQLDKEIDADMAGTADQSVETIAAQIRSLSDEQRAVLTTTLQQPNQQGVKVPADQVTEPEGN